MSLFTYKQCFEWFFEKSPFPIKRFIECFCITVEYPLDKFADRVLSILAEQEMIVIQH